MIIYIARGVMAHCMCSPWIVAVTLMGSHAGVGDALCDSYKW